MFGIFGPGNLENESLRKENAELRKELTEIRQRQLLIDLMSPYREQQLKQTIGLGAGILQR